MFAQGPKLTLRGKRKFTPMKVEANYPHDGGLRDFERPYSISYNYTNHDCCLCNIGSRPNKIKLLCISQVYLVMSQGKYFGRLKGYSLIIQKKSQLMAYDIMVLIQKNIQGEKKILLLKKKKVCYISFVP